jgi:hypothetical protein
MAVKEMRVKGQNFHSVLWALAELRGQAFRDEVLSSVTSEAGEALRYGTLLSSNLYPVGWYRELFRAAVALASETPNFAREVGKISAARDVKGVYRIVFRALSTETLVKQSPRLFKLFYEGGQVDVQEVRSGFARVRYSECRGFDRNVWLDLVGGSEGVLTAAGARDLRVRIEAGGGDGHDHLQATVTWT